MDNDTAFYATQGRERAAELLDEHDIGFLEHPLSPQGVDLAVSQAQNWLMLLASWDCMTAERLIGSGLSREQSEAFCKALLNPIYERVGRTDVDDEDAGEEEGDPDEKELDREFGERLFDVVREALTDAWNQGVETGKSHGLAVLVALKAMGITLAETENYKDIFERTVRYLHERTLGLGELLRPAGANEAKPERKRMTPFDVREWISEQPSDEEYRDSQESGTLPSDTWRAWAERMPTREEVADTRIEDDKQRLHAMMAAIQKKTWVDTVDQVLAKGFPDEIYQASPEEKAAETCYRGLMQGGLSVMEKVVPGFSNAMAEIDQIEDDDFRAMARKRCLDQAGERMDQHAERVLDDIKREKWRESPAGRIVRFLVTIGVLILLGLLAQSC